MYNVDALFDFVKYNITQYMTCYVCLVLVWNINAHMTWEEKIAF